MLFMNTQLIFKYKSNIICLSAPWGKLKYCNESNVRSKQHLVFSMSVLPKFVYKFNGNSINIP